MRCRAIGNGFDPNLTGRIVEIEKNKRVIGEEGRKRRGRRGSRKERRKRIEGTPVIIISCTSRRCGYSHGYRRFCNIRALIVVWFLPLPLPRRHGRSFSLSPPACLSLPVPLRPYLALPLFLPIASFFFLSSLSRRGRAHPVR